MLFLFEKGIGEDIPPEYDVRARVVPGSINPPVDVLGIVVVQPELDYVPVILKLGSVSVDIELLRGPSGYHEGSLHELDEERAR